MRRPLPISGWMYTCLLAAILSGCSGEPLGQISGTVTYQGQPVTSGSVVFEDSSAGISVNAPLGPDGSFTVETFDRDGLPPGTYQVAVSPRGFATEGAPLVTPGNESAPASPIPSKYHTPATSGLTREVKVGENVFKIELK